jgi:hypothetical protein
MVPKIEVMWVWLPICHGLGGVALPSLVMAALGAFGQPATGWHGMGFYPWSLALLWPVLADPFLFVTCHRLVRADLGGDEARSLRLARSRSWYGPHVGLLASLANAGLPLCAC